MVLGRGGAMARLRRTCGAEDFAHALCGSTPLLSCVQRLAHALYWFNAKGRTRLPWCYQKLSVESSAVGVGVHLTFSG
jgi:hypothetical protein